MEDIDTRRSTTLVSTDAQEVAAEMLALLRATAKRKASDDGDKVYALLRLLPTQNLITPDYTLSTKDIYITISSQIIAQRRSLAPLHGDLGRKNRADLPSWVPDWSAVVDDRELYRTKYMSLYNASGVHHIEYIASVAELRSYVSKDVIQAPVLNMTGDILRGSSTPFRYGNLQLRWQKVLVALYAPLGKDLPKLTVRIPTPYHTSHRAHMDQFHLPAQFIGTVEGVLHSGIELLSINQLQELCYSYNQQHRVYQLSKPDRAFSLRAFVFYLGFGKGRIRRLQETVDDAVEERFLSRLQYRFDTPDPLGLDTVMNIMARRRCLVTIKNNMGQCTK